MKTKKRTRKSNKPNPNGNFVSPLLRQNDDSVESNLKVAFNFPTTPKRADNSKKGNNKNSGLFREKSNGGVTLSHSLLVQPGSERSVANSNTSFNFTGTTIARTSKLPKKIPTKGQKVLPLISTKPINELLEVPLQPLRGSSKKQKKDEMLIEKSLSKLQVDTQSTNDQINVSTVEIKVESNLIKNEPSIIDSESSSSESSSSEEDDVVISKVTTIDGSVIVLEDTESEDENVDVAWTEEEGEILLDDSAVEKMNLSHELDVRFRSTNRQNQIFIGNLPSSMNRLHVSKFFERYGNIADLKFIRSKVKKTTICFITYKDRSSVNSSLEANGLLYGGHNFCVAKVGRTPVIVDCTVMVTNLPDGTSSQNLYDVFEVCGLIKSQYVVKAKDKLLAYITFELKISAAYAVLLNNFHLKGHQIYVHQYTNQRENQGLSNMIT